MTYGPVVMEIQVAHWARVANGSVAINCIASGDNGFKKLVHVRVNCCPDPQEHVGVDISTNSQIIASVDFEKYVQFIKPQSFQLLAKNEESNYFCEINETHTSTSRMNFGT